MTFSNVSLEGVMGHDALGDYINEDVKTVVIDVKQVKIATLDGTRMSHDQDDDEFCVSCHTNEMGTSLRCWYRVG